MSRDMPCYLISEPELDELARPDRLKVVGEVSAIVIGAAASATVSFGIIGRWEAFAASLIGGAFAGWVAWKSRSPKDQHDEMISRIKKASYEPRPIRPGGGRFRTKLAGGTPPRAKQLPPD